MIILAGLQAVADDVVVAGVPAHGDAIVGQDGITKLATDNHQQLTLATAVTTRGARVVLDADLPRYYAAWSGRSPDTMKLLQNIVVYLAN